jgi:hypothetical protein
VGIAVGALIAVLALAGAAAQADLPDNDIVAKPVGVKTSDDTTTVVGSRQPTVNMQFNFGSTSNVYVMCSADLGPFTSCGTPVPAASCPVSACFVFKPTFATDGDHRVDGAIFDSTVQAPPGDLSALLDETGYMVHIDSTLPGTELTSVSPTFDFEHRSNSGVPVSYRYKTIDDDDPILYEDTAQCALTTGSAAPAPASWAKCGTAQRVPITRQIYRFWVRTVDFLGRPDPTPAESAPFSPTACAANLVSHPHSLRQMVQQGLRLSLSCVQPTAYSLTLQMPLKEAEALNQRHRDISSPVVAHLSGKTKTENESQVLTLKMLRGIPNDLLAVAHLRLDLVVGAGAAQFMIKRVTGS